MSNTMKIKKKYIILLYPNNILIYLTNNYLIIKGFLKTIKLPLKLNNVTNLLYIYSKIQIKMSSSLFNKLIFYYNKKYYNKFLAKYYINLIKKYIEIVSFGFINILQLWGIGYKISKKKHLLILNLGYSHSICLLESNSYFSKPIDNTYIFNTGLTKCNLLQNTIVYKCLRKIDKYKGKGIRTLNQKIKLKIGKRD